MNSAYYFVFFFSQYLETNIDGVFSGGDTCNAPVYGTKDIKASIGHWQLAQHHGRIAALNMLGKKEPIKSVPFFFSSMFSLNLRYAGNLNQRFQNCIIALMAIIFN